MPFIIKMMTGEAFKVTDEEFKYILGKKGEVFIKSCMASINLNMVACKYPERSADEVVKRKEMQTGVLHDGTRVKRHFGQWVDADSTAIDDKGNYTTVRIDPVYYPEINLDSVFTPEEYAQYKHLPKKERIELLVGDKGQRLQAQDPQNISDLLQKKVIPTTQKLTT